MFENILNSSQSTLTITQAALCLSCALICGLLIAFTYLKSGRHTKSFAITLVLLPILVQIVIMMVNGNLGTGVAVLGAFSLIRFRSVAGKAQDICTIFFAMVIGLAIGAGYVTFALVVTVIICAIYFVLAKSKFANGNSHEKEISITIPEDLNYSEVFDDVFKTYTTSYELVKVKTTNLGSMFKITYKVVMKDLQSEKKLIDDLRCRNGNLTIVVAKEGLAKQEEL